MASRDAAITDEDRGLENRRALENRVTHDDLRRFEEGEKLALLDCVVACAAQDLVIPKWARHELARVALRYLYGISASLDDALFGAKKASGRHSKAVTKRRKEAQHRLWFYIVTAYKAKGLKGDALWEAAAEEAKSVYMDALGHGLERSLPKGIKPPRAPSEETIRKAYQKMRRKGAKPSGLSMHLTMLFSTWDEIRNMGLEK